MDIVISTDSRYCTPAKVTIASVCQNNIGQDIIFHVLTNHESETTVKELKKVADGFNQNINFYVVDNDLLDGVRFDNANRPIYFSIATYYRLFLCRLLPDSVSKVIYMDCDILCHGPLCGMWDIDMTGKAVYGASDMYEGDISFYNRLQYYPSEGYFNAGVLLINLNYWREYNCEKVFLEFMAEHYDRIFHHDQDVLNYTLRGAKGMLPFKYNVQDGYLYPEYHFLKWPFEDEFREAISDPVLIHYTGRFKPWCDECNHPWKSEYMAVAESIGLKQSDFPEIKPERMTLYQRIRSLLVKAHIIPQTLAFREDIPALYR